MYILTKISKHSHWLKLYNDFLFKFLPYQSATIYLAVCKEPHYFLPYIPITSP